MVLSDQGREQMTVRDEMDLLRRENTEMRKVLSEIAEMSFTNRTAAARAQTILNKLSETDDEHWERLPHSVRAWGTISNE